IGEIVTAQPGTASTFPGVQRNKGPCGVHGLAVACTSHLHGRGAPVAYNPRMLERHPDNPGYS
ncbi:hypothetical protein GIB67_041772, partial [Kingdonia uniflora]